MAELYLTAAHWRAASMFVSKDPDSAMSAICVEPAGSNMVRLIAGDGPTALLMRVHALHSLEGPALITPLGKNPKPSELNEHKQMTFDRRPADSHKLFATPEMLARTVLEAESTAAPVKLDHRLLERLIKAAKLLSSNITLVAQPANKACLASLTYGLLGAGEAALSVLMPMGARDTEAAANAINDAWDCFCADERDLATEEVAA